MSDSIDISTAPLKPGIYIMRNAEGQVLYVGKAKRLRNRLKQYFGQSVHDTKTTHLLQHVCAVEWIVTRTEKEALLLENQHIKRYTPRYNILLRDDKSYPYIVLGGGDFPRIQLIRGRLKGEGRLYGPYTSRASAARTLDELHDLFQLRSCRDREFQTRRRPCLEHQIKRCCAPCVGCVTPEDYQERVGHARSFLSGESPELMANAAAQMNRHAEARAYERASYYRDLIQKLRATYQQQAVHHEELDTDLFAIVKEGDCAVIAVLPLREQETHRCQTFVQKKVLDEPAVLLEQFIYDYYQAFVGQWPFAKRKTIVTSVKIDTTVCDAISDMAQVRLQVLHQPRGDRRRQLEIAQANAVERMQQLNTQAEELARRFEALQERLGFDEPVQTLECFDISHHQGSSTYGSCVCVTADGPQPSRYRLYRCATAGDDYAALEQVVRRRYAAMLKRGQSFPDIVLIDGGLGQVRAAHAAFEAIGNHPRFLCGISKGRTRRLGDETLVTADGRQWTWSRHEPALLAFQSARDEAHRFALKHHRADKKKAMKHSFLETIEGVGKAKAHTLLTHFGGLQMLKQASEEELRQVPGVGPQLAQKILQALREET